MTQLAGFELQGSEELRAALRASPRVALEVIGAALYREANDIMTQSKNWEVPVKTGVLRASGVVHAPQVTDEGVEVVLGYGGAAQAYAVIQHERTDFHHTVGKAHYLSDPMLAAVSGMEERLASAVWAADLFPGLP